MSTEQIVKFQPDRTLYLRGVDGAGAAAALFNTTPNSFSLAGVFRDMADFCVLVIYDADNTFEHYSVRYLPDTNVSGMTLTFDYTTNGVQPLDSVKYSWIDWGILDVVSEYGETAIQIPLLSCATVKSGNLTAATATVNIQCSTVTTIYDRLTLFINNVAIDFIADGGEDATGVAGALAYKINAQTLWYTFAQNSVSVLATVSGAELTLTYARSGVVDTNGNVVTCDSRYTKNTFNFAGLTPGMQICLNGFFHTIATVDSATQLTLIDAPDSSNGGGVSVPYTAPRGGIDGNSLTAYIVVRSANVDLGVDKTVLPFSGAVSDGITWTISVDFAAWNINQIRQAWLTFAPQLPASSAYTDTEWAAEISNWSVTDPQGVGTFDIAGPGSFRIGNADAECTYSANWTTVAANNYWRGFSQQSAVAGASVSVNYSSAYTHDLYLGTAFLYSYGIVNISVDGVPGMLLNCYIPSVNAQLVTRRLLASQLAPGDHSVVITVTGTYKISDSNDAGRAGTNFVFDYLEAAVPTPNIPDAVITYPNVSPALDFDTDATYKMSPERLFWHLRKLGFYGHLNEYLGVFWWNQRVRAGSLWNVVAVLTFSGTWAEGDYAGISFGPANKNPFTMYKSVVAADTVDTIANHFVYYINSATVATWAAKTGTGELTIYARTPNWGEIVNKASQFNSAQGLFDLTFPLIGTPPSTLLQPNTVIGDPGFWQVDPTAANPLNIAVRQWHSDFFSLIAAANMLITVSFSMELVNPPYDDGTEANAWQARFYDGSVVTTDTGFSSLFSSQCAFVPKMTNFQSQVFTAMASLQAAASLTPWLQFGEFLWWFFSSVSAPISNVTSAGDNVTITYSIPLNAQGVPTTSTTPMVTGDRVTITGVNGCTAVNGTWTINVPEDGPAYTFTIPVTANGNWVANTGLVRGGSMAYYDAATLAAAQAQFPTNHPPLYKFTTQDDDPTVNNGADADFLAGRLKLHIDAIRSAVLAQYPNTKFEILYPNDVNNPICLLGPSVPYPQGGRLNAAVNLPAAWQTQATSGLDSFKVEALSWSAQYLDMDRAQHAVVFALAPPMAWDQSNVAYLIPWFNGTCPWPREFLAATSRGLNIVNFWAYDHLCLMSWPLPLNPSLERSGFLG